MGTCLEVHPVLGRVLVATQDFGIGDLVLDEAPLIVYNDLNDFLNQYVALSNKKRLALLDMFHPPLDKDTAAITMTRREAAAMASLHTKLGIDLIHKLIMIAKTNAHQYVGASQSYYESVVGGTHRSALFDLGSKVAHSCCPNVLNSTKNKAGHIHFRAAWPIKKGDHLAMSYIDDIWATPTAQRQSRLLFTKDFRCGCTRCLSPDDCRVFTCPRQCGLAAKLEPPDADRTAWWNCSTCGNLSDSEMKDRLSIETALAAKLSEAKACVQSGGLHRCLPDTLEKLLSEVVRGLSPIHYLVVQVLKFTAMVCASHAVQTKRMMETYGSARTLCGTPAELRLLAARAGIRSAQVCECIAASCCNGDGCAVNHPVVQECGQTVFHAAQDLLAAGPERQSVEAAVAVSRYLPAMRLLFGEEDADVNEVDEMVEAVLAKERLGPHPSQLPRGCEVLLHSLQGGAEHNGKKGVVKQYLSDKQRYAVEVCGARMSLKASNLLQLLRVLCGGHEGTITDFSPEGIKVSIDGTFKTCRMDDVTLPEGTRVRLHSLSREEYNQKVVAIKNFDSKAGRYHVLMDKHITFSVLPAKISLRL